MGALGIALAVGEKLLWELRQRVGRAETNVVPGVHVGKRCCVAGMRQVAIFGAQPGVVGTARTAAAGAAAATALLASVVELGDDGRRAVRHRQIVIVRRAARRCEDAPAAWLPQLLLLRGAAKQLCILGGHKGDGSDTRASTHILV
eukprot:scaffold539_cov359-Prasinococcus_capsulatus_cf.AAC.26